MTALPMLQGAADAHRFATRRDDRETAWSNAATTETLAQLDHHLRVYRLIAWAARATDTRPRHIGLVEAGAEIIAAAAERLGEVDRG